MDDGNLHPDQLLPRDLYVFVQFDKSDCPNIKMYLFK